MYQEALVGISSCIDVLQVLANFWKRIQLRHKQRRLSCAHADQRNRVYETMYTLVVAISSHGHMIFEIMCMMNN